MKFVSLISTGIDSPVASYLISKHSDEMILLHADIRPFTDERDMNNFTRLAKHLDKIISVPVKVFVIPHGHVLSDYRSSCDDKYTCVFCKRMLLRYAEKIVDNEKADAIVMGDSLGQVASQTLQNIKTIDNVVKTPIIRPLIGFDKDEVVKIAREIGTFDLSILPSFDCKAVPIKPATQAKIEKINTEEEKIKIKDLIDKSIDETYRLFI